MPALRKRLTDENILDLPIKRKRYICYDTQVLDWVCVCRSARRSFLSRASMERHRASRWASLARSRLIKRENAHGECTISCKASTTSTLHSARYSKTSR